MVRMCVLQEVKRFAVKQIKEKTTAVSANQESGLFCSSRQNLSTLPSSSLSSNLAHPYLYSVTRAARNTSIVHIQIASLGNKTSDMRVSLPASNAVLPTITEPIKARLVSNESLKKLSFDSYKQNVQIGFSCFTTGVGSMSGMISIRVRAADS